MGFCLLPNCAIAAADALHPGAGGAGCCAGLGCGPLKRHPAHCRENRNIAYCSRHQYPFYPGSGSADERGPLGNLLNIPLSAGSAGADYLRELQVRAIPFLKAHRHDLLLISAGFDAAWYDPLGGMELTAEDYAEMLQTCWEINAPVVVGLAGGYSPNTLGKASVAVVRELQEHSRGRYHRRQISAHLDRFGRIQHAHRGQCVGLRWHSPAFYFRPTGGTRHVRKRSFDSWLENNKIYGLNIAGSRESEKPIYARTLAVLRDLLAGVTFEIKGYIEGKC